MNCVNRNSKEFKFLAEHNDLSINALELITHKYWLENKTEDYFPSDVYIQAQLGKIPYEEPTKVVRELWDLKYKDSQEFASLEDLEEARKEALRYFPEEAVTYHTNFKGNYVLTIRKPIAKLSIDISDLTGKTTHDGQEQADFNLLVNSLGLNTIQNNIKELQLSISSPQTFTFKDGTTVKAPFKPNYQQEDALNAMDEFINSNRTSMTLSGYAGTGKTSLMEMLAEKMRKQYKPVMFCASTNKAAAVLKERVSKSGFEAQTLNKVFGITVEVDPTKSYNAKNLVNKLKGVDIPYGTTVIIDEASMINEENYAILNNIAKNNGLKIIYVGDAAQLAPVNETKISKVFRDQNHEVRTLSIVERTGDNAILKEATDLRNGKALSGESSFNSKGQGVAYLKPSSTQEREAIIKRFIPELKSNPNYFRILAYTNAAVAAYNTQVRQLLGYNDNIPRVGEPITGYANWGYNLKTKSYKFINSEAYKVVEVNSPKKERISLSDGSTVTMQAVPITLENSLGERDTFNLMDIKGNLENRRIATQLANMKSQLWNKARGLSGKAKAPILQQINAIDEFLFVNDNITEGERTLQAKVFDFGYAMTVHKSQGSTFTHVLMDDVDINKAKDERNTGIGMEDIAIGWEDAANNEPVNYEVAGPMEDIDMGDWEDETPSTEGTLIQEAPKTENPNAANIRQQLKYVAVSRATDTVTIISDNVKKEDTPLNHINEAPASQEATQQKPVEQMSSTEVWRYLSAMQPLTKRSQVEYTPKGQARQTYIVENGHIYNSKGTEVYPGKTVHKNMILANHAVKEGLAIVVEHPTSGEKYVVDNNQQITSVRTGKIMEWGEENGDRRRILAQAEKEFRERVTATKEKGNTLNEQMLDQLKLIGLDLHYEDEMAQYLKEHGINSLQEFIGKKARAQFEQSLKKARPDMSEAEIKSTLDFLHSLEDSKENIAYIKTAIKWVANRSLTLPQDHTKAYQAFELARKKHLDLQKYNTLGELITAPEMQPKKKEKAKFNPDEAKTFTNKKTVTTEGGRVFTVYDVEDTEKGQREVCKALAAHYEMSPWCLSTFTATGEPTQSAKNYWDLYKALPRKIAYENGKPVAFNSDKYGKGVAETLFRGTPIITSGEESIIDSTERGKLSRGTIDAWKQEGLVVESKILPNALRLTEKAKKEIYNTTGEAWWDMEDTHPQNSLSDSIVADPNKQPILEEMREDDPDMAEYLYQEHLQQEQQALDDMMEAWGRMTPEEREQEEENWEEINLPWFLTPEGEVRGFATPEGSLYFDRTVMSPEHPIHEYTHLWDRVVAKNNPELWHRGVALMKKISLWKDIENDENYGKKWKALKGMTHEKLESLIASEVHSRLTGVNGEQILDRLSKEKGQKGIIGKLKQWLLDFWKDLKGTFSNWSQEDLDKLTLQDFTIMTIRDFADGFNPNTFSASSTSGATNMITQQSTQQQALTITPAKSVDRKATAKGSISNKYIGFADGITGSSTAEYARQAGDKANVGVYSPEDTIFVSIPGMRGNAEIRHREQQKTIDEALKALRQGATLITDNEAYTNNSSYNEGEKKLAQALKNAGAVYSERTVDGQILGVWKLQQSAPQQSTQFEYARNANGRPNYEVSSKGDKRFSAMTATFAPGTTLFGHDVSGRTIESVYQHGVKQGDWTTDNNSKTGAPKDKTIITGNTENDSYTQGYLPLWQEWARQNPPLIEELRQKAQGKVITDMFASTAVSQARALADILNSTINQNNNRSNNKIEYGNDFRRIQETVRRDSQGSSVLRRDIGEDSRRRLARITKLELDSNTSPQRNSQWTGVSNKGVHYNIIGDIPAQLFHDIFEVVRYYTVNGELVDLHDDYSDCKCYLSDDGTCGFAIEPNGNLVSVFNLGLNRGFLSAIKDIAIAQGANHLDAFDSNVQPLRKIYEHTLGAKVASSMDYNMEFDHDDIAKNHGNPQVVFMVMGKAAEGKIKEKHFNENQYDEAQAYQQSFLPAQQQPTEEPLDTSAIFQNPSSTEVTVEDKMKPWGSDPSKQNISRRIYLKGHKDKGYFEVVKDFEDGYYSVHFKPTDSNNPNAFSKEEKETLFQAVADTIPVGGKLSTWGELSRGGIAGLERFSKLGFAKSGERTVTMKGTDEEVTIPVFTKYPDTTTRISLKGYEYFTDAYEDTLVDAPWKIPFLQELDRQFSTENPEGKNEEIVNQMKAILEAKSYEEWQNNTDSKTKEQVQKNLNEYDKLITQLNNLLDSDVITASEVRHVAELVVNAISDNITQLQKEKGLAEQQFPTLNSKLDFQTASRKDIINTIGINRLIHRAKLLFDPEANDYEDLDTIEQADLIIDNWDAIMTLASDIFAANEGVGISRDFDNGGWHSLEGQKIDYDNFNDYGNDPDAMAEETKDEQEHWQVEQRTIDILNSMSAMVRLALHECYQVDKEGNIIKSKWGIPERVNARNAVNSILRWTQGSLSLEDMITKLSAKQAQQPWLGQLIERLNDKSGNETDFQSQFYGVFAKHFQFYSVVLLEDGKYHSMTVNSHPALSEAMQTITTQFKVGEHPLFTSRGINRTLLGNEDTTSPKATFNLHKVLAEMRLLCDRINHGEDVNTEIAEIAANNIMGVCRVLGYPVTESMVSEIINNDNILYLTEKLGFIVNSLDKAAEANKKDYDPFAYKKENSIGGSLRNFLTPITDQLEDTATNAFYDSGKMYQSYVTPSFMTKLLQKFRLKGQAFEDFLDSEYGNSEWFKFKGRNGAWRNEWLRMLATNEEARKVFDHKVELNFNKHNYMRNMSDAEYTLSLFAEYFAESSDDKQSMVPAWFRIPMQSNKPSSEFIKFYSYRGANYKNDITDGMYNMFLQELSRIQTIRMRNLPKNHPSFIKNFDKNGKMFNFLPFFNSYLEDTAATKKGRNLLNATDSIDENADFAKILQKKLRGDELSSDEEANLMKYAKKAIYNHMDRRAQEILDRWEQESILEAAKQVEGVGKEDADVRNSIENYLWNDAFAAKNILQLTVGDIAFYKDAEDLQKRLAQLHAPGIRGNIAATDYQGNRVSDGYYRTFILQDFDTFRSNIIANITEVFDRKIARAPKSQKAQLEALKDSLVRPPKTNGQDDKGGKYWNINVTDAQGYSSPSSYRKKAFIFGKWSHKAEDIYQKMLSGDYNYTDLEVAFQPLKPFVYTHLKKHMGDGTPIETMNVPFQAKNSEYLLIMADAIMQSEVKESGELSRPNLLRAVYRVMEDSEKANKTKGIDTVQFESAIKSGLQGKMNIHQFAEVAGGEDAAYTFMMSQIYQNYDPAKPLNEQQLQYNTDTFVHEASFEDYCLQQEVPEHFKEHSQAHGSQIRMITPSDLDLYKDPNGNPNDENNINYYEWTEPDGTKRRLRADEFKKEYEQTIADNIAESIENLSKELHLDSLDKKERNIALSKILLREILSSPRYGVDLAQACAVDKNTGEFRIPKGDPIQAKRIEQLINSIIKNRVNKQKIAGGPIVQVTNFGTSKQLHIRFNARSGGLLKMESEFTPDEKYKTYDEYKKAEQAGIAYFEVFIPIWANEIFEKFANEDGTIDVKAIEAIDPDLLKMISYRIPTEDKYSCAPMKAVGFMPREAGDAIMLPYELTEIDDSDFDVDKRYVMRKDIQIVENKKAIEKLLIQKVSESYAKAHDGKVNKRFIVEQVKMYMDNPDRMKTADKLMEYIHSQKQLIMKQYKDKVYKTIKPTTGKKYRDNKIVDMTWAVLTNEITADKILNPGGFDNFKRVGYMAAAYRLKSREMSWEQLQGKTTDELNDLCYVDKDLTWADTQVQFYKQNAAAASLIGVFAVNKVAHATLEGDDIFLAIDEVCGEEPFTIGSTVFGGKRNVYGEPLLTEKEFKQKAKELSAFRETYSSYEDYVAINEDTSRTGRMQVDPKYDHEGNLIGKTLGSGVSASADAAKTPVLNLLNINMTTVGTFTSLIRLGMSHEDACLFIGQDIIARVLDDFNRQNLTGYASLNSVINKEIQRLKEKYDISENSAINTEPLTKEELIEGLTSSEHEVIDYKVLIAFQKAKAMADSVRKLSFPTRFNSISSAVGPLIIDNLILEHKMEQFMDENEDTHFYTADDVNVDITDIFADHPILNQFSKTVDIAKQMTSDMPAGSTGFRNLLNKIPDDVKEKLYNDKKLFSTLSDFYQSYLAIASGLVNPANLKNYIDGFPKWFMKENFKEKYPDNALIQAIQMTVSKRTGRAFLSIKLTGEDETVKESYRNAWIDLHKTNPELSQQLFEYCFFRAGIGFSPKTFMAVVPTYVKERLQRQLSNGEKATYLDTYRKFPSVSEEVLFDQFIANNWEDNKLVPRKGGKNSHFIIKGTELYATTPEDIANLEGLSYIKTSGKGETYLWKKVSGDENEVHYTQMKPLGNNGEYLEISLNRIDNPMTTTTQTSENNDASEIKTTSTSETDATEEKQEPLTTENKRAKAIAALARDYITYNETNFNRKISDLKAVNQAEDMVNNPERFGSLMQNMLKSKGIEMSKEEAIKKLKELNLC